MIAPAGVGLPRDRLREESGDEFPRKVTAFRPQMAVHGKFGKPCPVCGAPVQRIRYKDNETNYCAKCQTGGRVLSATPVGKGSERGYSVRVLVDGKRVKQYYVDADGRMSSR